MASSRNATGLKILWIPGRKRHDRKGIYSATKKEVNKNYLPQRKNQVWSLGGPSEQKKLINLDVNDDVVASGSSAAHNLVDPLCAAAGATAMKNCENLNLNETNADQEKIVDKEIRGPCNNDNVDIDAEDQDYHNAATMRFKSKKRGSNNTDLDSIEHLSDDESGKKCLEDEMDSVSMHRMKSERVELRRRRKAIKDENKKMQKKLKEKKKDESSGDKVVDCLYYSLMCADFPCTIM